MYGVAVSSDERFIASASEDMTVRIWNADDGRQIHCLKGHEGSVWSLAFRPTASCSPAAGQDGTIRIWNVGRGEQVLCWPGHDPGFQNTVVFSVDGRLASGSETGRFTLELRRWPGVALPASGSWCLERGLQRRRQAPCQRFAGRNDLPLGHDQRHETAAHRPK